MSESLPPRVRGLLETVARRLSGTPRRAEWVAAMNRGDVRAYLPASTCEWTVWVGKFPVWVCARCDGVFSAPDGLALVGSREDHERYCGVTSGYEPRGIRHEVLVRFRDPGKTEWDVRRHVKSLGGAVPHGRLRPSNRADEGWFEVWLPPGGAERLGAWDRARGVRAYV